MSSSFSVLLLWQNKQRKEAKAHFGSRFEMKWFRMARKAWRQEGELLGRSESSGNMNADAQLASPLFLSPGLLPLGCYHPQLRCVFPPPCRDVPGMLPPTVNVCLPSSMPRERQTQRFSSLVILDSVRLIILATMLLESKQEERAMYGME